MEFFIVMLSLILFCVFDIFIVRFEIKRNADLFYDIHRREVIFYLNKEGVKK